MSEFVVILLSVLGVSIGLAICQMIQKIVAKSRLRKYERWKTANDENINKYVDSVLKLAVEEIDDLNHIFLRNIALISAEEAISYIHKNHDKYFSAIKDDICKKVRFVHKYKNMTFDDIYKKEGNSLFYSCAKRLMLDIGFDYNLEINQSGWIEREIRDKRVAKRLAEFMSE